MNNQQNDEVSVERPNTNIQQDLADIENIIINQASISPDVKLKLKVSIMTMKHKLEILAEDTNDIIKSHHRNIKIINQALESQKLSHKTNESPSNNLNQTNNVIRSFECKNRTLFWEKRCLKIKLNFWKNKV